MSEKEGQEKRVRVLLDLQKEKEQLESKHKEKCEKANQDHAEFLKQMKGKETELEKQLKELKHNQEKEQIRAEADKQLAEQKLQMM